MIDSRDQTLGSLDHTESPQVQQEPEHKTDTMLPDPFMSVDLWTFCSHNEPVTQQLLENSHSAARDDIHDYSSMLDVSRQPIRGDDLISMEIFHHLDGFSQSNDFDFDIDFRLFPDSSSTNIDNLSDMEIEKISGPSGNVNRYHCETCTRSFQKRYQLNRHKKTHTRPFKCEAPNCPEAFAERRDLKRHIKARHISLVRPANLVKCHRCDFTAKRADSVKRHVRSQHQVPGDIKVKDLQALRLLPRIAEPRN